MPDNWPTHTPYRRDVWYFEPGHIQQLGEAWLMVSRKESQGIIVTMRLRPAVISFWMIKFQFICWQSCQFKDSVWVHGPGSIEMIPQENCRSKTQPGLKTLKWCSINHFLTFQGIEMCSTVSLQSHHTTGIQWQPSHTCMTKGWDNGVGGHHHTCWS